MSCCLALTRKWKLCSNYATLSEDISGSYIRDFTCKHHTGFFDNPGAIKEKWFVAKEGGYAHYLHISPWTMKWIESCLSLGIIQITKEDIEILRPEPHMLRTAPRWAYFFLLCARHVEGFCYSWNPRLWEMTVYTLWFWSRRIGPVYITRQDLQLFICVKGCLYEFYKGVEQGPREMEEEEWFQFFEACSVEQPEWFETFIGYPIEEHKKYMKGVTASVRYTAWILTKKKHLFDRCKRRSCITNNELFAVTYHPARYKAWIMTSEEIHEMNERWITDEESEVAPLQWILEEVRNSLKIE